MKVALIIVIFAAGAVLIAAQGEVSMHPKGMQSGSGELRSELKPWATKEDLKEEESKIDRSGKDDKG